MEFLSLQKITFLFFISIVFSCNTDKLMSDMTEGCTDPVTYNDQIKPIIDESCAYSGCHDGASIPPGNFQNYTGLQAFLSDDLFKRYVIDLKDDANQGMPPSYAPAGKPQDLTQEQLDLVECWIADAYPE